MPSYLLDTTVIIDFLRGERRTLDFLSRIVSQGGTVGCCLVNIVEVYSGVRDNETEMAEKLFDSLEYYEIDRAVAKQAGTYRRQYIKKGITLSPSDVLLAVVAISNGLTFLTDNRKHYPMPEISLQEIKTKGLA